MAQVLRQESISITPSPQTRTGRVVYTNPSMGYYAVLPDGSPVGLDGVVIAMDNNAYDAIGAGITVSIPYSVGTSVRYIQKDTDKNSPASIATITGADKYVYESTDGICHTPWTIGSDVKAIYGDNDIVTDAYLKVQNLNVTIKDRSFGTPLDMSDGAYVVNGSLKNYIYVGYGVSAIGGGYDNNLTFFTETNGCVFSTGGYYIHDTLISREEVYSDLNGQGISLKQTAFNIIESLGVTSDKAFKESKDASGTYCTPQEKGQFPIYRMQELAGSLGQGKSLNISCYKKDSAPKVNTTHIGEDSLKEGIIDANESVKTPELVQYGVSSINTPWDGSVSISSLNSISLDKDYYIPYPVQIATESNIPPYEDLQEGKPVVPESVYSSLTEDIKKYATQAASSLYAYSKLLNVRRLYGSLLKRIRSWKLFTFEEVSKSLGIKEEKLEPLALTSPCYESKMVEVDDPIAEAKSLIEALSAFIHVSPSGAIVISDGHGAEIRLEGGNITISPSADLKILPGRNVIGFVPGNLELLAKDRVDIASDNDKVTIKGEADVNVLSAKGTVSVESIATENIKVTGDGQWTGGGIILKSASGVSVSGSNISIRRQAIEDTSEGRSEMRSEGVIVIDANNGSLVTYGNNIMSVATGTNAAVGKSSATVLSDSFQIASPQTALPGNVIIGGNTAVTLTVPQITKSGIKETKVKVSGSGGKKALIVSGNTVVTDSLAVSGIAVNNLAANALAASRGRIDSASYLSGLKPDKTAQEIPTPNEALKEAATAASTINNSGMRIVDGITTGVISVCSSDPIYKASTISTVKLKYPSTSDYKADSFFIVQSRWQKALDSSADSWGEPNLVNDSMIYPGKDKWVSKECVYSVVAEGLSTEYTYNDMFKDTKVSFTLKKKGALGKAYTINKPKE